ncbi:hypothetical protein DY000_02031263 [Brassica cretica]|uniref:Uncharacterized protein n=1 Tax=Brassica cretica TaxID=69181 RepID=A0ABQ7DXN3_BRACR|nr:hypothetical protein DY000_02031263 [Brassica cretica]
MVLGLRLGLDYFLQILDKTGPSSTKPTWGDLSPPHDPLPPRHHPSVYVSRSHRLAPSTPGNTHLNKIQNDSASVSDHSSLHVPELN